MIPEGWTIKMEGDTCLVQGPGDTGFYVGHEHDRDNIASVILYRFAKAVLSQGKREEPTP